MRQIGGDVGLSRGREGVEGWAVWALEESEEDDESVDKIGNGDDTNVTPNPSGVWKRAETPVTEWDRERVGDVEHIVVRQPAYRTRMWSYPPRQRVQKRVTETEKEGDDGKADRVDGDEKSRGKRSGGGNGHARKNSNQGSSNSSSSGSSSRCARRQKQLLCQHQQ